jgi:hypothetical protein
VTTVANKDDIKNSNSNDKYPNEGTLFIVDAQRGYQDSDTHGMWKFAMSLLLRAKREGRQGITWFGDATHFSVLRRLKS